MSTSKFFKDKTLMITGGTGSGLENRLPEAV